MYLQLDVNLSLAWPEGAENPQMRKFVVSSILDSEKGYVDMLNILMQVTIMMATRKSRNSIQWCLS